jgi:RNA polymerase sigma-70 factor (subfamily 1)
MDQATSTFNLIERIRSGDREALSTLFDRQRRRLAVLAHYRMGPHMRGLVEVDDILQETLLKAFVQFDQFTYRAPGSFLHWLTRIMEHVIADTARYHGRQKRQAGELAPLRSEGTPEGVEPVDSKTPSRLLSQDEAFTSLLRDLDALPDDYREVILLIKVEGLSTQEAAERMGKSREAIALLLHRAIQRLRKDRQRKGDA